MTNKKQKTKRINGYTGRGKSTKKIKEAFEMKGKKHTYSPCRQKQCGFLNNGCPKCSDCGAESNTVDEGCKTCFDCEYKPGCLRNGENQHSNEDIKQIILNKMKDLKIQKKQLLMANGELADEEENNTRKESEPRQHNNLMGGEDFEKQLQAELIKQMASNILATAQDAAMKGKDEKENSKCKGKCKDHSKEEEQEEPKRVVPYIGYIA